MLEQLNYLINQKLLILNRTLILGKYYYQRLLLIKVTLFYTIWELIEIIETKKYNDYGHALIKLCQLSGTFICNGRVNGDIEGNFTYVDKKGKSTIDY